MQYAEDDKNKLLAYYDKLIINHKDNTSQAQGWASNETENKRFEIFLKIGDINNRSILDVGCGFGDLYDFLKRKNLDFSYTGIDINPEMIKAAKEKHSNAEFQTIDFGNPEFTDKFDYIFCSGALSFRVPNYKEFYFTQIKKMFELSKIGVGFNMLTIQNNTNPGDDNLYATYSVEEVSEFCSKLTPKMKVYSDYLPNDFTVFLYH